MILAALTKCKFFFLKNLYEKTFLIPAILAAKYILKLG
jgi:hypothetical protein